MAKSHLFTTTTQCTGKMMEEIEITSDEIIINIVRDNKYIYDKTDAHYKNNGKKKNIWKTISFQLKNVYGVNMSAKDVEKRWTALRDMFSREKRKKKLAPSESGKSESKEWHLYQSLLFLSSHIAHRTRTTGSLLTKSTKTASCQTVPLQQTSSQLLEKNNFSCNITTPVISAIVKEEVEVENILTDYTYSEPEIIDYDAQSSVMSPDCSHSSSSSFLSTPTFSKVATNSTRKKSAPPLDDFAKQKKIKSSQLDEQLIQTGTAISDAMNTVSTLISSTSNKEKDGYMLAIEEGLKHVPGKNRTLCIIEILQIIQKYEVRD